MCFPVLFHKFQDAEVAYGCMVIMRSHVLLLVLLPPVVGWVGYSVRACIRACCVRTQHCLAPASRGCKDIYGVETLKQWKRSGERMIRCIGLLYSVGILLVPVEA